MANPSGLWLFSPAAPMGSQLFPLGDGRDGAYNPGANANLDDFDAYQFTSLNIASGITISRAVYRGPLVILVQGEATIGGSINLNIKGTERPTPGSCVWANGARGFGIGGGAGGISGATSRGGGGGGFGAAGGSTGSASGGIAWSDPDLSIFDSGCSGGNGGAQSTPGNVRGGEGGGAILLVARRISLTGTITVNGGAGGSSGSGDGGGGGGSGGAVFLVTLEMSIGTNLITALGGAGGTAGNGNGGAGAVGRIRLDYATKSGSTNPAAHEHSGVTLGYLKQFAASAGLGM